MKTIYAANAIIVQLLVLGIEKVCYRHLNAIKAKLQAIMPWEYYIDLDCCCDGCGPLIDAPNALAREENYEIFTRGWCAKSQEDILAILQRNLNFSPFYKELIGKLNELDLEAIHQQVFTQEYIEKCYLWEIPKEYRVQFVQICHDFAKEQLAAGEAA